MAKRKLGEAQASCLRSIKERGGYWQFGCGWIWDTASGTTRIMESLVKRGLLTKHAVSKRDVMGRGYLYRLVKEKTDGS